MIYIVSGLPRSGTSMMMKMLEAGGLPVLVDADNPSTDNHPGGRYEYKLARMMSKGANEWITDAKGKVVKILLHSLYNLPDTFQYKVVFMQRNIYEVIASQTKMGILSGNDYIYTNMILQFNHWLKSKTTIEILFVNYNDLMKQSAPIIANVADFIGQDLNTGKMAKVPKKKLYRNRMP
jgi:hypothetical protein